jgi:hypothetical protein
MIIINSIRLRSERFNYDFLWNGYWKSFVFFEVFFFPSKSISYPKQGKEYKETREKSMMVRLGTIYLFKVQKGSGT